MGMHTPLVSLGIDAWTGKPYHLCSKKSLLALAMLVLLIVCMASERLAFKIMIDRMESYRYFLCQFMTFLYIPPLFIIVGISSTHEELIQEDVSEFPKIHFIVMGILDLLSSMLLFLAGGRTDPLQTLLLMQASIPLTTCMSVLFYHTKYSRVQIFGNIIMVLGILVAMLPTIDDFYSKRFETRESGWNTIFYLLAAVPGALSMIYKERTLREQPMDMLYLNAWVTTCQFVGGLLLAPLVFNTEVFHLSQKMSGLECLINGKNELPIDNCRYGLLLLLVYVVSNVGINFLLVQVLRLTSINVMNRTTLVGFAAAFGLLAWYQFGEEDSAATATSSKGLTPMWTHTTTGMLAILSFLALLVGKVMYQWDQDPALQATTTSAEDKEVRSLLSDDIARYT